MRIVSPSWNWFKDYYAKADWRVVAIVLLSAFTLIVGRCYELLVLHKRARVLDGVLLPLISVAFLYFVCVAVARTQRS